MANEYKHSELTSKIIAGFYRVYNRLGYGFLEKVYENAMMIELQNSGLTVLKQAAIEVFYDGQLVGNYLADLLVNDSVIVELKAAEVLAPEHEAQLLNYLKATPFEIGLLFNFGPKPRVVRKILDNDRKGLPTWKPKS